MQICILAWRVDYMFNVLGHENTLAKFQTKILWNKSSMKVYS